MKENDIPENVTFIIEKNIDEIGPEDHRVYYTAYCEEHSIYTQGDTIQEVYSMISDATLCCFENSFPKQLTILNNFYI